MTEDHIPTDDTLSPHLLSHSASMHSVDVDIDQEEELSQQQITHLDTPKSRYNTAREWFNKATTSQPFAHLLIIGCQIVSSTVLRSNVTHTGDMHQSVVCRILHFGPIHAQNHQLIAVYDHQIGINGCDTLSLVTVGGSQP